ncbi:MAG: AMP-binding protein [Myxococcales bacterium]
MGDSYDLPAMLASLDLERDAECPELIWLEESRGEPDRFWDAVFRWAQLNGRGLQTRRHTHYELYLDLVERHRGSNAVAMLWWEREGMRTLTFDELAARSLRCAEAWVRQGVKPGVRVALALSVGCEYLVAFCALLCLGANVMVVDPGPPNAMLHQVRLSQATKIVRSEFGNGEPIIDGVAAIRVTSEGKPRTVRPHAYQPQEPCWWTLSPLSTRPGTPVSARCAFESALSDATFALRLDARSRLATPGWSLRQYQPSLISACLLAGCAFVHVTLEQLRAKPSLLVDAKVTCLGTSHGLLRAIGAESRPLATVEHLVRPVDEPLDWASCRDFLSHTDLNRVPCSSLLMDAALGGSVLFSTRRKGIFSARVLPSVGRRFSLNDASTGESEGITNTGVLQLQTEPHAATAQNGSEPAKPEAFLLLARCGNEWFYGGTISPRRGSHCYPVDYVVASVERMSGVTGACVVPVPQMTAHGFWMFSLLVFVESLQDGPSTAQIESILGSEIGSEAIPDRIEVVPFHPRRAKRKVDIAWYERRYQTSRLSRLFRASPYHLLSSLRSRLTGPNPSCGCPA